MIEQPKTMSPTSTKKEDKWWKRGYYYDSPFTTSTSYKGSILDDWYKNDDRDSIFEFDYGKKYKSSIGWERGRLSTISYTSWTSSYAHSSKTLSTSEKILTCAYKSVRDIVVILNFPFQVDIKVTNKNLGGYYYTAASVGKRVARISIPTRILDEKESKYNQQDKIDIFCGLGVHEAAHLKFTQSKIFSKLEETIKGVSSFDVTDYARLNFLKTIINLIEDERIEDKLLSERPGYSDFIEKAKKYLYQNFIDQVLAKDDVKLNRYLNNLFKLLRWPDKLEEHILEEFSDSFKVVKDIIFPLPESTKESVIKGIKIFEEISRYFKEIKMSVPETKDKTDSEWESDLYQALLNSSNRISKSFFDVLYGYDEDISLSMKDEIVSRDVKGTGSLFEDIFSGKVEKGLGKNVYISVAPGEKYLYNNLAFRVSKYVPGIRKLIKGSDKNYEFSIYGCRSGLLDTNKLAEAYQGVPQVYIRKGYVKTNKTTVCVLIDESGSMSWSGKDEKARLAAILLNEALSGMSGVDLYIYGHSADLSEFGGEGTTVLYKYKEGSNQSDTLKYSLTNSRARWENRDGTAIWEAANRVRKFTQNPCLMFVLSDGSPAAYRYHGTAAEQDVKENVAKVEKMGFTVIQVCIDTVPRAKYMFSNVIDLKNDIANLPKQLSCLIKKLIVKDKKTEIS